MPIANENCSVTYDGDGAELDFPTTFMFLDDTHLVVTLVSAAGVETVQTLGTHYNVDGAGDPEPGGTVTMVTAPAIAETLEIKRRTPITQDVEFKQTGPYSASSLTRALDKAAMISQEIRAEAAALQSLESVITPTGITGVRTNKDFTTNAASVEATFPFNVAVAAGSTATDCILTRLQNLDDPTEVFDELPGIQWAPGVGANISIKRIGGLKPNTNYRARFLTFFP